MDTWFWIIYIKNKKKNFETAINNPQKRWIFQSCSTDDNKSLGTTLPVPQHENILMLLHFQDTPPCLSQPGGGKKNIKQAISDFKGKYKYSPLLIFNWFLFDTKPTLPNMTHLQLKPGVYIHCIKRYMHFFHSCSWSIRI